MARIASLAALLVAGAFASACSGDNPNELTGSADRGQGTDTDGTQPASSSGASGSSTSSSSSSSSSSGSSSSGSSGTPDAGTDTGAPKPKDAFDGAPAFAAKLGPTTRKAGHNFANATPTTNPAGRACLNCHGAAGGAPTFSAAGTVYVGATPASSVEVRVVGNDGKAYSAFTDADGNFFFRNATQLIEFPAMVGARNASGERLMAGLPTSGNCNQCHGSGGGAGRIVVGP